ncbi:uncharacterized protein LOC129720591 [Wyeomyia smithii]|uniref:uncharacterized protein LOC129720591 n=1 Tax=Wyeomyia smithii TaxID=174621 RepID=UPI0024680912|nr:uncharacterized protein LOC129720591 [Wyeomyia smithii]
MLRKETKYRNYIEDMKYLGRHKLIIFFNSWMQANSLIDEKVINEKGYQAYIPRHVVCITGVVNGIDTDIDIEYLKQETESSAQVVKVYRLNRWDREKMKKEATNRVSFTFRARNLPEKIKLFGVVAKVQPFVKKTEMCKNCHRYGHNHENCKSKKRCDRCAQVHDENSSQCIKAIRCLHCRVSSHRSIDEECPAREREVGIKKLMSRQNLTYVEAKEIVAPSLSSNRYQLLTNSDDFPTIQESFAKMTAGKYVHKQINSDGRNLRRNNVTPSQTLNAQSHIGKRKKTDEENIRIDNVGASNSTSVKPPTNKQTDTIYGTGLNNPHTATTTERLQAMYEKGKAHAQETVYRNMREMAHFKLLQCNIQSLVKNKEELQHVLMVGDYSAALISETWTKLELESTSKYNISRYHRFLKSRFDNYGGCAIFLKDSLGYTTINLPSTSNSMQTVAIKVCSWNMVLVSIYVAPSITNTEFETDISNLFYFLKQFSRVLIAGDLNCHHITWDEIKMDI